jgi:hypothetical protein
MDVGYQELEHEMRQRKRRLSALEGAFDSILTKDDLQAIEDGRVDLKKGRTIGLTPAKKGRK